MNNKDNTKELFDDNDLSENDMITHVIEQLNNIYKNEEDSHLGNYIFITGNKTVANELNEYIDELYFDKSYAFNIPIIKYDKNCPSDAGFLFREAFSPIVCKFID